MVYYPTILQMWMNVALVPMCVDRRTDCAKISQDHSSVSVNKARSEMETSAKVLNMGLWDLSSDLETLEAFLRVILRIIAKEKLREQRKEGVEIDPLPSRSTRSLCKRTSLGNNRNLKPPVQPSLMRNMCIISDIDECANPKDVCPYLTECINTVGSYICDCKELGFKADGKKCLGTLCIKYQSNSILHVVIGPDCKF